MPILKPGHRQSTNGKWLPEERAGLDSATGLRIPIVNLNGTNQDDLTQQYANAAYAIEQAITKVALSGPHGRDYQLNPEGDLQAAIEQHRLRLSQLERVREELERIATAVADQAQDRRRQRQR